MNKNDYSSIIDFGFFILFSILIIGSFLLWSENKKSTEKEMQKYKFNFKEAAEFSGEILKIKQLKRARHRGTIIFCVKPNFISFDSSQILLDNPFFINLDSVVTTVYFGPWLKEVGEEDLWKKMSKLHFNKNGDKRFILYNTNGDSIDASSIWSGFQNSRDTK